VFAKTCFEMRKWQSGSPGAVGIGGTKRGSGNMRTEKGYRFSLQFPAATKEQRQIGELLERLRSKKSRFIVDALREYLAAHPEKWKTNSCNDAVGFSRDDLKDLIREVLAERGMVIQI